MAWTAQLTKAEPVAGNANVAITLTITSDSGEVQTSSNTANSWTDEQIAIEAQTAIVALETRDANLAALKTKLASGPVAITLPRDGFPTPNADAQAAAFAQAAKIAGLSQQIAQLNTLSAAASAGLIAPDDPALAAAQSVVKATTGATTTTASASPASP